MSPLELRRLAHQTLCLSEMPLLKHHATGRFERFGKIACTKNATPGPSFNFVAVLEAPLPELRDILPIADAFFGPDRTAYGVLVEGDDSEPLESELKNNGYHVFEDEPAFVRPQLNDVQVPAHPLQIRLVQSPEDFRTYCRLVTESFQAPPEMAETLMPLSCLTDPLVRIFVGSFQGEPISTVCSLITGKVAHVAGTSTRNVHRGRGLGAAMVLHALEDAQKLGCHAAALRSGPLSIPLYQRLGFQYACQHRTYALQSPELATPPRQD